MRDFGKNMINRKTCRTGWYAAKQKQKQKEQEQAAQDEGA